MRTPEEWGAEVWRRWNTHVTDGGLRALFTEVLTEALAERDAALARAEANERLARCQRWDSETEDDRDRWDAIKRSALEEVRGKVLAFCREKLLTDEPLMKGAWTSWLADQLQSGALGPSRPPLPPTQAEEELEALREKVRFLAEGILKYPKCSMLDLQRVAREILGEHT